ncbi:hypothetical protein [Maribacter sp. 2307ULW6-5]|uniref:hypothetical protein n=1 Tax=Maribacter sp. 2307ULW6-5 TaxID=3386275 RepID=UPI0039BC2E99
MLFKDLLSKELEERAARQLKAKDSVHISFGPFGGLDEMYRLGRDLRREVPRELGKYDSHDLALDNSHGTLEAHGPNAEKLYKAMLPVLQTYDFLRNATVKLVFVGNDGSTSDIEFELEAAKPGNAP